MEVAAHAPHPKVRQVPSRLQYQPATAPTRPHGPGRMEDGIGIKDAKRRHVQKRIFPGYILVKMKMSNESWFVVRNTPGVTSFVGSANSSVPLQEKEVRAIQKQMKQEAPKIRVEFQVGESVRVVDGPFTDFHGKVDEINPEKGKLKVLVNMFGRETPVELDLLQVEKVY